MRCAMQSILIWRFHSRKGMLNPATPNGMLQTTNEHGYVRHIEPVAYDTILCDQIDRRLADCSRVRRMTYIMVQREFLRKEG